MKDKHVHIIRKEFIQTNLTSNALALTQTSEHFHCKCSIDPADFFLSSYKIYTLSFKHMLSKLKRYIFCQIRFCQCEGIAMAEERFGLQPPLHFSPRACVSSYTYSKLFSWWVGSTVGSVCSSRKPKSDLVLTGPSRHQHVVAKKWRYGWVGGGGL